MPLRLRNLAFALASALALVAGCTGSEAPLASEPPACEGDRGENVAGRAVGVHYLNDGGLSGRLCVRLNDVGPLEARIERRSTIPDTARLGTPTVLGEELRVEAWLAGNATRAVGSFPWASENYVVIVTESNGTLRIDHFAQQPTFD
jgi:hypothetical protein